MINVTKTFLPDFDTYASILRRAWDNNHITNNGKLVQELEHKLNIHLNTENLLFCSNGTVVLQMALKALGITKSVITTPFSYVATTNAILWEGCKPVFVDIDPVTLCIDHNKIEQAITSDTEAILATHVYGYPCAVKEIQEIASKYNLKVIYDGAHAFGCELNSQSLLNYGDISTCSFHATKLFHTVEGGCIITNNSEIGQKLYLQRSFGHIGDVYYDIGINGKNSEFHAAMGLAILPELNKLINYRKEVFSWYEEMLDIPLLKPDFYKLEGFKYNYSYCPILLDSENLLLKIMQALLDKEIIPRRYFYPSLNKLPFVDGQSCPISESYAKRVLCLPLFYGLEKEEVYLISNTINTVL
jgi:dTDP-4-amino-4,6-dideoxygalactose transaminase